METEDYDIEDSPGRFLAGIAAVVRREDDGRILLLKRAASKDYGVGVWECVTGRVQQGEGFEEALFREVREETRLHVEVDFVIGTSHFYRGEARPENELVGVVFRCSTDSPEALLTSEEHADFAWMTLQEARVALSGPEPGTQWMLRVIDRMTILEAHTAPEVIAHYRAEGVETG